VNIDWQQLALNLRRHQSTSALARDLGIDPSVLQRLARNEILEPRFSLGLQLLNLHLDHCPDKHQALLKS
jgi:hypothetical protein